MYRVNELEEIFSSFIDTPNKETFEACVLTSCHSFKKVQNQHLIETKFSSTAGLTSPAAELMLNNLIQGKIWFLQYLNELATVGDVQIICVADDENAWAIQVHFWTIVIKCPTWAVKDRIYQQMVYDCIQKLKKTKQ